MSFTSVTNGLVLESLKRTEVAATLAQPRRSSALRGTASFRFAILALALLLGALTSRTASAQTFGCTPAKANDIVCENSKTGNPSSDWDVDGAGDSTIQGFATDISVNQGGTISFKVNTNAKAYTIDIYRIGYYAGLGARKITSVTPSAKLPQTQPACLSNAAAQFVDCGNWAVSASWTVPTNATSGVYIAHLIRTDTGGDSHIVFIVRNDASHSAMLFQTSDESWQAYNNYGAGGFSLYGDGGEFDLPNRGLKVSYNRPFITRGFDSEAATWLFSSEFAMIQFIEQNGYDVTYFTGVDAARNGALIKNHKIYTSTGHDEYWSGPHRTNVEAARDAGVNLAFFSGNEVFWKTRWENSIDGTNTAYRTLTCYKETLAFAKIDPSDPPTWTGTWRDPSFSPPADGGRPENSLTGTLFMVNGPGTDNDGTQFIKVPAADGKMRFWRNTAVASQAAGATYSLPASTLGYEWDVDPDNGFRPAGAFDLSTTTYNLTVDYLLDYGATYGGGTATHHLVMYKAPSGALVFGAGTVGWAWGLNSNHDDPFGNPQNPDVNMQQATVNLFADMGVQPASLMGGLLLATASTDHTAPISTITSPASGASIPAGTPFTITGTASDGGGGVVGGVEVSTDGGTTWHPATGRGSWTYSWTPTQLGSATIKTRGTDDSGNIETPSAGRTVSVAAHDCPCDAWTSSSTPVGTDSGDGGSIEVGVKFRSDYNGFITGVRFYKASTNTGTHIGNLWSSTGALLATATFTGESASGWQQVNFSAPVAITSNTTYIASYFAPVGHYSADSAFFATKGVDNPPVHLLQNGVDGSNGIYTYSSVSAFPTSTFNSTNYWVDVVFLPSQSMPGAPPAILLNPGTLSFTGSTGQANPPSQTVTLINEGTGTLNWTATSNQSWLTVSPASGSAPNTLTIGVKSSTLAVGNYTGMITVTAPGSTNGAQTISVSLVVTNILMSTNFANGTLDGWVVSPLGLASNWTVASQAATYNGSGPTQLYAGNSAWTNYTAGASFKLSSLSNYPGGIRGRVNPTTGASYIAWLYPAQGLVRLYKGTTWSVDTGVLTQLGVASAAFDTTNYHIVQLAFSGTQVQVLYDGKVIITATDSTNTSGVIALDVYNQPISFTNVLVTSNSAPSGSYTLSSTALSYSAPYLGANPTPQTVQLTSTGGTMAWTAASTASWLTVTPTNGVSPASLQVSAASSTLAAGTYTGSIRVVSYGAVTTTQTINATLTVIAPPPSLGVSPGSLSFVATTNTGNPAAQVLSIVNPGSGTFTWTASSDSSWLSASPASGSAPGTASISVNATGLAIGSYTGHITITATGIANSPLTIPVALQVLSQDMTETFTDLGTGWILSPMGNAGGWTASGGIYTYNGGGLSQTCAGNSAWTNYNFDTNIQLASLANWPGGVRARVNPSTGAGYAVWLYPGTGSMILYKVGQWNINGAVLTQLAQAPLTFDTATHDLTVAFSGSLITVSWDGRQLMSVTDTSYTAGYVCLDTDSQPISYSNVRVAAVQAQAQLATPSPSSISFGALPGNIPAPQVLNISAGSASTTWGASVSAGAPWLSLTASNSLTPGTLTVSANPTGLAEGVYTATITLSAPGAANSPISIPVTLAVKTAILSVTPTTMNFFGAPTLNPVPQTFQVTNAGTGTLGWSSTVSSTWLGQSATSGAAPATVTVSPNVSTLANGTYHSTISIASPDVTNSPATISVATQVGTLLFTDNFSPGAGNWTVGPLGFASGWSVVNNAYTYNGGGHTQSWAGSSSWTDYTVATNFQLSSTADYPGGLRGRVNPTTGASYGAWIYPAEGIIRLFGIGQWNIDGGNTLLGTATGLAMNTNVHTLRLSFQGTTIQVYYDEVLVITATDATYAQGAVALDVSNQPIAFDNVTVISLP
jgi:hypothetical protein